MSVNMKADCDVMEEIEENGIIGEYAKCIMFINFDRNIPPADDLFVEES